MVRLKTALQIEIFVNKVYICILHTHINTPLEERIILKILNLKGESLIKAAAVIHYLGTILNSATNVGCLICQKSLIHSEVLL